MQKAVLGALCEEPPGPLRGWRTPVELASTMYGKGPTRAQVESVRRALKTLAAAGKVELDVQSEPVWVRATRFNAGEGQVQRRKHVADRGVLVAHLTLSVEERAARDQHYADSLEALVALDKRIIDRG